MLLAAPALWAQSIGGVVTDATTHLPLQYAQVIAGDDSGDVMADITKEDGSFTLEDLPAGELRVRVERRDYRSTMAKVSVIDGAMTRRSFEIRPMASVDVRVADRETGEQLPARFSLNREGGGRFDMTGLEPGDYSLMIETLSRPWIDFEPYHKHDPVKRYQAPPYPVTRLGEGEHRLIEIKVSPTPAYTLTGKVELAEGFADLPLQLELDDDWRPQMQVRERGATGAFRIEGLLPGAHQILAIAGMKPNQQFGHATVTITDHDVDGLKIQLTPGVGITWSVRMAEADAPALSNNLGLLLPVNGLTAQIRRLDGNRADGIAPGEYWPQFRAPQGYAVSDVLAGGVSTGGHPVTVRGGEDLTFVVTSKPGTIVGTVRNPNQAPLKGESVTLIPLATEDPDLIRTEVSDASGAFVFRDLAPGAYRIEGGREVRVRPAETARVEVIR